MFKSCLRNVTLERKGHAETQEGHSSATEVHQVLDQAPALSLESGWGPCKPGHELLWRETQHLPLGPLSMPLFISYCKK